MNTQPWAALISARHQEMTLSCGTSALQDESFRIEIHITFSLTEYSSDSQSKTSYFGAKL